MMILVPCSLFYLNEADRTLRRRETVNSPSSSPERTPLRSAVSRAGGSLKDLLYQLQGQLLIETLVLWRESRLGEKHFIPLTESELASLEDDLRNLKVRESHRLSDVEVDKMGQSIGMCLDTGDFTRNPLLWHNMCSLDGEFTFSRESVLIVEVDVGAEFQFVLSDHEFSEMLKVNHTRLPGSEERENLFLQCTLDLLKDKHAKELHETEAYRRMYYRSFPAPNELMMYGWLKKRNKSLGWKERFVALAPGKLFYVEKSIGNSSLAPQSGTIPPISNGSSSASTTPSKDPSVSTGTISSSKVIRLVPGRTWVRIAGDAGGTGTPSSLFIQNKYDSERTFELLVSEEDSDVGIGGGPSSIRSSADLTVTKYHWACDSREDRDKWVHLIRAAASLGESESVTHAHLDGIAKIKSEVSQCESVEAYLEYLKLLEGREVPISVDFVQTSLNRARGEMDASLEQTSKDTARDSVLVNGQPVIPCTLSSVMGVLTQKMATIVEDASISPTTLLDFARLVMLATNRTQSGGLAYEAVNLVLMRDGMVLIPTSSDSTKPSPIIITIERPSQSAAALSSPMSQSTEVAPPSSEVTPAQPLSAPGSGSKRRFHTRTVSDPQSLFKFLTIAGISGGEKSASMGVMTAVSSGGLSVLPSAPSEPRPSVPNPTSPKNSLIRSLSMRKKTIESEGLIVTMTRPHEEHIKLRVKVKAEMTFNLLDEMDITRRLAVISATFTRTFCLAEGRCFAADQGSIVLRLSHVVLKMLDETGEIEDGDDRTSQAGTPVRGSLGEEGDGEVRFGKLREVSDEEDDEEEEEFEERVVEDVDLDEL